MKRSRKQAMAHTGLHPLLIWDGDRTPFTFGGAIMLIEEGLALDHQNGTNALDVAIVGVPGLAGDGTGEVLVIDDTQQVSSAILQVLIGIKGCRRLIVASSESVFRNWLEAEDQEYFLWPGKIGETRPDYQLGSGLFCAKIHAEGGRLPALTMADELNQWARQLLASQATDGPAITVHLKNNPNVNGESNADFESWYAFFASVQGQASFFLVGNEAIPAKIRALPHVSWVLDNGGSAARDLALITLSDGFMGMASAFCQAAIFSDIPYVIFKNPDHHKEEMAQELQGRDYFSFSGPRQKIWMKHETENNLIQALSLILETP